MTWLRRLASWIALVFKEAWSLAYPKRARTQTWMFLTFALFVGAAVFGVGLYAGLVLKGQFENATKRMLRDQGVRLVAALVDAPSEADAWFAMDQASRLLDMRIIVMRDDTLLFDVRGEPFKHNIQLPPDIEGMPVLPGRLDFQEHRTEDGTTVLIGAMTPPDSPYSLRLIVPEPPLYALVNQMMIALIGGMIATFILTLFGSWVASREVTKPLEAINKSASSINEGKFDQKIYVDSRAAEFQDLAKNLNRMSDRFRGKIEDLQNLARLQGEFIGNVSHEVRNPIFAVSGYLEALSSPNLSPDQQKRYAQKGLANLERLSNLFNDLIEIARLEYREDLIKPAVFDLQELGLEVAEMLRPKAISKELELEVVNAPQSVLADRDRVRQVLVNLIENAIVYTDAGHVRFRFRRRGQKVRLEVVDTGRGIPEEHLERIFERFYRVDPDRSRKSGGTGLGLSIVKQILLAHDEQIHVESTPGRGTRFWFDLPYAGENTEHDVD